MNFDPKLPGKTRQQSLRRRAELRHWLGILPVMIPIVGCEQRDFQGDIPSFQHAMDQPLSASKKQRDGVARASSKMDNW